MTAFDFMAFLVLAFIGTFTFAVVALVIWECLDMDRPTYRADAHLPECRYDGGTGYGGPLPVRSRPFRVGVGSRRLRGGPESQDTLPRARQTHQCAHRDFDKIADNERTFIEQCRICGRQRARLYH